MPNVVPATSKFAPAVQAYLEAMPQPLHGRVVALCNAILRENSQLAMRIKWNAPSFADGAEDRITFRFPPKGGAQLIFHRGAKAKALAGFQFEDASGLMAWPAADRGVLSLPSDADWDELTPVVVELVRLWLLATRAP